MGAHMLKAYNITKQQYLVKSLKEDNESFDSLLFTYAPDWSEQDYIVTIFMKNKQYLVLTAITFRRKMLFYRRGWIKR